MGRPRKPTALVLLGGMGKRNPGRLAAQGRDKEPQNSDPLPAGAPEWMTPLQAFYYDKVVRTCHKDVLCIADETVVSMAATYMARMEEQQGVLDDRSAGKLLNCLDRLGMTPSARSKVQAIPRDNEEDSELKEFGT